ncbi:hypothetical protein HBB16_01575 [Pseudonocardia sp. MCCB 268]|nr:hypothetical protein [Pseudonocardia cytotoxica]
MEVSDTGEGASGRDLVAHVFDRGVSAQSSAGSGWHGPDADRGRRRPAGAVQARPPVFRIYRQPGPTDVAATAPPADRSSRAEQRRDRVPYRRGAAGVPPEGRRVSPGPCDGVSGRQPRPGGTMAAEDDRSSRTPGGHLRPRTCRGPHRRADGRDPGPNRGARVDDAVVPARRAAAAPILEALSAQRLRTIVEDVPRQAGAGAGLPCPARGLRPAARRVRGSLEPLVGGAATGADLEGP